MNYIKCPYQLSVDFGGNKMAISNCDNCVSYEYDEEYNEYICMMNLDQDEMEKFVNYSFTNCPYYKFYDEYKTVNKQN